MSLELISLTTATRFCQFAGILLSIWEGYGDSLDFPTKSGAYRKLSHIHLITCACLFRPSPQKSSRGHIPRIEAPRRGYHVSLARLQEAQAAKASGDASWDTGFKAYRTFFVTLTQRGWDAGMLFAVRHRSVWVAAAGRLCGTSACMQSNSSRGFCSG